MRNPIRLLCCLLVLGLLSACGGGEKFVKPIAANVAQDPLPDDVPQYKDGYLRIFVTSNLDKTGRMLDFGDEDERPAKLLITARFDKGTIANFTDDSEPEIPVLLYDLTSDKVESSVVDNALLTEGLLIDPESLSKSPHLQIIVRGVPPDKARWVTNLLETTAPVAQVGLAFVPGAAVFNPISYKVGSLLGDEIKTTGKPWEERTLLGMRADEGVSALDGRTFVVLLNPSKVELDAPPELVRCRKTGAITGLCLTSGEPWTPDQAYVRFELDVSYYRSIKDYLGADVSCEFNERNWVDYRSLINSGQLARLQTQYEALLMDRGDQLMEIRRGLTSQYGPPYITKVLQYAQQYATLRNPDDAFWNDHFKDRAAALDACIRDTAQRGKSSYLTVWDAVIPVFARARFYNDWNRFLQENANPEDPVLRNAQRDLQLLDSVLDIQELREIRNQDSLISLTQPKQQLESMIAASYRNMLRQIDDSDEPTGSKLERYALLMRQSSPCDYCKALLQPKIEALNQQLADEQAAAAAQTAPGPAAIEVPPTDAGAEPAAEPQPEAAAPAEAAPAAETAPGPAAEPAADSPPDAHALAPGEGGSPTP